MVYICRYFPVAVIIMVKPKYNCGNLLVSRKRQLEISTERLTLVGGFNAINVFPSVKKENSVATGRREVKMKFESVDGINQAIRGPRRGTDGCGFSIRSKLSPVIGGPAEFKFAFQVSSQALPILCPIATPPPPTLSTSSQ